MFHETLTSLAQATRGRILRDAPGRTISGHFTDTRAPIPGALFVALRGENFDGNKYAREAAERHGAAAVLVERESAASQLPEGVGAILVDDARIALLGIAATHRARHNACCWLGVTGSVGKSTTKEMLGHILKMCAAGKKVHKAPGSFNNEIGLSQTILETPADADFTVLELGTNHPGEIERLANTARPNIAVITRAAESHIENFGSVENIAREKGAILKFQTENDTAILNADDDHVAIWKDMAQGKIITFALNAPATFRASNIELNAQGCARFTLIERFSNPPREIELQCELGVPGTHQVSNALAAIAAASAAGIEVSLASASMRSFKGVARRFTIHNLKGVTLIDDAYNASPTSFAAALETLKSIKANRRFVLAGGMLELGAQSLTRHRELGALLASMDLSGISVVGNLACEIGVSAIKNGFESFAVNFFHEPENAAEFLSIMLRPGDALLVKGSHGIHLERSVQRLVEALK